MVLPLSVDCPYVLENQYSRVNRMLVYVLGIVRTVLLPRPNFEIWMMRASIRSPLNQREVYTRDANGQDGELQLHLQEARTNLHKRELFQLFSIDLSFHKMFFSFTNLLVQWIKMVVSLNFVVQRNTGDNPGEREDRVSSV